MALLVKIDPDGTITYGEDDTEHLLSNPTMRERLLHAIKDADAGNFAAVMMINPETAEIEFHDASLVHS